MTWALDSAVVRQYEPAFYVPKAAGQDPDS
jgi:hypothetical protein